MSVLTDNPTLGMYVAAVVALVVVIGLFAYLWAIDRRVRELRRALAERRADHPATPIATEPLRPQRRLQEEQR